MPEDKFFGMIASRAISHGYDNSYFNFSKAGWYVNTIHQNSYFICIKIIKDGVTYYMLCHEGTQTADQFKTDLEAINNKKRKKVGRTLRKSDPLPVSRIANWLGEIAMSLTAKYIVTI